MGMGIEVTGEPYIPKGTKTIRRKKESKGTKKRFNEEFGRTIKANGFTTMAIDLLDFIMFEIDLATKRAEEKSRLETLEWIGKILIYKHEDKVREMIACEIVNLKSKNINIK